MVIERIIYSLTEIKFQTICYLYEYFDLRAANMSCAGLGTCSLEGAIFDETTIWHENYNAMEHGAIKLE